jgi:hypothetical protein
MELDIDVKALKAISLFASTDGTRYYLQGVQVEITPCEIRFVATDGKRLAAIRMNLEGVDVPNERMAFIIPSTLIAMIKMDKKSRSSGRMTVADNKVTLEWYSQTFTSRVVDGTFPDWERVFPRDYSNEPAQFDPNDLFDFKKAARILDGGNISVTHNGNSPALVNFSGTYDCAGLIMPLSEKAHLPMLSSTPHWIRQTPAVTNHEKVAEPA